MFFESPYFGLQIYIPKKYELSDIWRETNMRYLIINWRFLIQEIYANQDTMTTLTIVLMMSSFPENYFFMYTCSCTHLVDTVILIQIVVFKMSSFSQLKRPPFWTLKVVAIKFNT